MNSKGSYAFYQPSGEQFHVGDPGEICVGQDITDNTTGMKISMVIYLVTFNYILQLTSH